MSLRRPRSKTMRVVLLVREEKCWMRKQSEGTVRRAEGLEGDMKKRSGSVREPAERAETVILGRLLSVLDGEDSMVSFMRLYVEKEYE